MALEQNRTFLANQAVHLSDLINLKFATKRYGTSHPRLVRVREPDGPSTEGGRKARQAILLVTENEDESTFVVGFVDISKHHAEIRSYPVLKTAFEQRHGRELDLSRSEYNRFLDDLQELLHIQAFEVRISNVPRAPSMVAHPTATPTVKSPTTLPLVALLLSFAFGFFVCWLLMTNGFLR